jgi:DNA-binding XRE family transcriptional regulator
MDHKKFQVFRQKLGKTQKQLSELLGTSLKAIQSFEQGWFLCISSVRYSFSSLLRTKGQTMPGPAGRRGTVPWKHAVTAQRGNSVQAVSAGLSMGPCVRENLKPTGAAR